MSGQNHPRFEGASTGEKITRIVDASISRIAISIEEMSRRSLIFAMAALMFGRSAHAQLASGCPVRPLTLKAMHGCYRPLLVFAPTSRDASFVAQQALFEQYADDMMDRNILYVPVLTQGAHFQQPLDAPYVELNPAERNAIRSKFQVAPSDFLIVLVGKDGGEKFRTKKPISVLKLDALVDAMPMGREEKSSRPAKLP